MLHRRPGIPGDIRRRRTPRRPHRDISPPCDRGRVGWDSDRPRSRAGKPPRRRLTTCPASKCCIDPSSWSWSSRPDRTCRTPGGRRPDRCPAHTADSVLDGGGAERAGDMYQSHWPTWLTVFWTAERGRKGRRHVPITLTHTADSVLDGGGQKGQETCTIYIGPHGWQCSGRKAQVQHNPHTGRMIRCIATCGNTTMLIKTTE